MFGFGKKPPPGRAPTRIAGTVDPQALERARQAVEVKVAKTRIKTMAGKEDGARKLADALRKMLKE